MQINGRKIKRRRPSRFVQQVLSNCKTRAKIALSQLLMNLKAEAHDATNRCDTSPRQVAAISPRVICENHCRCDRILSLRPVAQIQTGLNSCDISQRQTKRRRLVAAAVQTRRLVATTCRRDLWHRVSRP